MIRFVVLSALFAACNFGCKDGSHSSFAQTGAGPNDILIVKEHGRTSLVVAASLDSAVQFYDVSNDSGTPLKGPTASVFFKPNALLKSPNPWSLSAEPDGRFLAVSLYDDHSVALINLQSRTLHSITAPEQAILKHPTTLKFHGNNLFVLFTNFIEWDPTPGQPPRYEQGAVARFILEGNKLKWVESLQLPCVNPTDLAVDEAGQLAIVCSGRIKMNLQKEMQLHDGAALVKVELSQFDGPTPLLNLGASIGLNSFSPAKLIPHRDGIFVSSSIKRQILFVPTLATLESETTLIALNPEAPEESGYLPAFFKWSEDVAFVADYRNDQLVAINLNERRINPAPFSDPIAVGHHNKSLTFKGAQSVARRGDELFVLMGLSSEIIPVTLGNSVSK